MQWSRRQEGYAAHWSKIDFLLAQDPTTKLWSVRADGKRCTTKGKLKTWKSAQAAMDDMDERQTAILRARRGVKGLFRRPAALREAAGLFLEAQAEQAAKGRPTLIATVADGPCRIATVFRRSGLPPMTAEERALVVQRAAHQTKQASNV
jgi:hypothetical protein